jgi:YVTN family beta-propeller protein
MALRLSNRKRRQVLVAGLVVTALSSACSHTEPGSESWATELVSTDGSTRFTLNASREKVEIRDARTGAPLADVRVGKAPARLALSPDGKLYVSNRGSRSVSVIAPAPYREEGRIEVGIEPTGLAVSADGRVLYVVNAGSFAQVDAGTLTAIDAVTRRKLWQVAVGQDPREIRLIREGEGHLERRALVTRYLQPDAVEVDLTTHQTRLVKANLHASR